MGLNYLMDTNVIIEYTAKKFTGSAEAQLDIAFSGDFYFSAITRIEVLGFNAPLIVLQGLKDFLDLGIQYHLTDSIINQTILIRRALPKIKTPDAIIAATALVNNHILISSDTADFKNIPSLTCLNPYTL